MANTAEYEFKIETELEADIATEFGDGTAFKVGDTVLHNHVEGRFRKLEAQEVGHGK